MKVLLRSLGNSDLGRLVFFLFILIGGSLVFILTPDLFPSALISALLFFIFSPLIDGMERRGVSRTMAILSLFLICGSLIATTMSVLSPHIANELDGIQKGSSRYASGITDRLRKQEAGLLAEYPILKNANLTEKALTWIQTSSEHVWQIAPNLASQLMVCLFLVPFLTFILLRDAHEIRRQLLKLVPNRYFETVYSLMSRILDEMGGYVAARILEAAIVTALVTVGCLIAKIPYAFMIGVFAGATNPIPYLGPLLGAIPGLMLALLEPAVPSHLLLITLIYTIANLIDMLVIFPVVVAKIVDLHPVVVVISVILGSQLFGVVGMIIAVPITSIVKILIQEIYSRVYNTQTESWIG